MDCSPPGSCVLHHLPELAKLMSIESVMPSSHLILCRPLLLLPSVCPSIRVFSVELALHAGWPKYWSFSFSISPLGLTCLISLQSRRLSRVFSSTTVWKFQFSGTQPFLWSNSHNLIISQNPISKPCTTEVRVPSYEFRGTQFSSLKHVESFGKYPAHGRGAKIHSLVIYLLTTNQERCWSLGTMLTQCPQIHGLLRQSSLKSGLSLFS